MTALATIKNAAAPVVHSWNPEKLELVREHIAKGHNDSQFAYYLEVAAAMGLNPLKREVYSIIRGGKQSFQVGIDGFRKIAHATGEFVGCSDATFREEPAFSGRGTELVCSVSVRRNVAGEVGTWVASARWSEYAQRTRDGAPMAMWAKMPKTMLAKCAEALALRKAFPNELGGLYSKAEMDQAGPADVIDAVVTQPDSPAPEPVDRVTECRRWWFAVTGDLHKQGLIPDVRNLDDHTRHLVQKACLGFSSFKDATIAEVSNFDARPKGPDEMVERIMGAIDQEKAKVADLAQYGSS